MKYRLTRTSALAALLVACMGLAAFSEEATLFELHAAPQGDDAQAGTAVAPLATLQAAQERVREHLAEQPETNVRVLLHEGVYRITEPLVFTSADVPAEGHTVVWTAAEGATARISGGRLITGWREHDDGTIRARIEEVTSGDWNFRELFVNGERRTRARHPNTGYHRVQEVGEDRRTNFTFAPGDVPEALEGDLSGTGLELGFIHDWSISRIPVASVNQEESRLHTQYNVGNVLEFYTMDNWEPDPRYWLENHPALLDAPGEWYLDIETGELAYILAEGETLENLEVVAPVSEGLIQVRGEPERPVRGLVFRGLHFEHAAWETPPQGYAGIQATAHNRRDGTAQTDQWRFVPAAIHFELAEDCAFENNRLQHLGGSGLWFGSRAHRNRIVGNLIDDVSGNGILIGEDLQRRVGDSSWTQAAPEQAAQANVIEDNIIQRCGVQFFGAVGIWVGMAADTEIRHNLVRHLPYTGISVGWVWNPTPTPNRGTIVEANHIHHVMQVLSDGGGIYTLGLQPGAALLGNLIHDVPLNFGRAESNGMFIDEGSMDMRIEGNVIYNIDRSPLRFHRAERNEVKDNVLVVPDEETPIVRYNATPEENIILTDNTVFTADEFDPSTVEAQRQRAGPRLHHQNVPNPGE